MWNLRLTYLWKRDNQRRQEEVICKQCSTTPGTSYR